MTILTLILWFAILISTLILGAIYAIAGIIVLEHYNVIDAEEDKDDFDMIIDCILCAGWPFVLAFHFLIN